jgi:hypothetical protein
LQVFAVALLRWLFLATALVACACAAQPAPQAPARAPDRFIYVSAGDVPSECYHDLDSVSFSEPFADAAMDGEGVRTATRLRALAIAKYPDQADAVINVHTAQNDVGTVVTVTGEVVELHQGHTVECVMRKAPGVIDRGMSVAAGGMMGAVVGGVIGAGTAGMMAGAAAGVATVGTYTAVEQHRKTLRQRAQLKSQLAAQQTEIARLLAKRTSLRNCVDDDVPLADCKLTGTLAAVSDSPKPADAPSYETEQPQFEVQKQIQEQQVYIQKLRDEVFELQQQLGGH